MTEALVQQSTTKKYSILRDYLEACKGDHTSALVCYLMDEEVDDIHTLSTGNSFNSLLSDRADFEIIDKRIWIKWSQDDWAEKVMLADPTQIEEVIAHLIESELVVRYIRTKELFPTLLTHRHPWE